MNVQDQIHFAERLSFLIKAEISLVESLRIMGIGSQKKQLIILNEIINFVSNGQTLAKSLSSKGKIFNQFLIHMIQVGEMSGTLAQNLHFAAEELKKRHLLKNKIRAALLYPALITIATCGITFLLMFYIFPKIIPIFKSMKMKLPLSTQFLLVLNDFIIHYWMRSIMVVFLVFVLVIFFYRRFKKIRALSHKVIIRAPVIGKIIRSFYIANFTRTTGLLLQGGIPVYEAININIETNSNIHYQTFFSELSSGIAQGKAISVLINKNQNLFPSIVGQMVDVGEKTGSLTQSLMYLSELFEAEVDSFTKSLSTAIEPVLMVCMGVVVGFVAISIITPIYEITQNLHH